MMMNPGCIVLLFGNPLNVNPSMNNVSPVCVCFFSLCLFNKKTYHDSTDISKRMSDLNSR